MRKQSPGAAGVLVFVHNSQVPRFMSFVDAMNASPPVSREVFQLYCVPPTRDATRALSNKLRDDPCLTHLDSIDKLKPNNALRDLTAPWRLTPEFCAEYELLVSLETVSDELRKQYPHPNLTLQAGKIEPGESPLDAAKRELFEEARIKPARVTGPPVPLMSRGMFMYSVFVTEMTSLFLCPDTGTLYID